MKNLCVLVLLSLTLTEISAAGLTCGIDQVGSDKSAQAEIKKIAETLPRIFRYDVIYDERLQAVISEPKCVVHWRDEFDAWNDLVAKQTSGLLSSTWRLNATVPAVTPLVARVQAATPGKLSTLKFEAGPAETHNLRLSGNGFSKWWTGELVREEVKGSPMKLDLRLPNCTPRAKNRFSYRTKTGQTMSTQQWRRALKKLPEASGCPV